MKRSYTVRSVMMLLAICIMLFACKQNDPEPTGEAGTEPKSGAETVASSTPSSASTTEDPNQRPADAEPFVCEWSSARDSFLTEDYILYHDNHGRVQIFDTKTKKDLVYCFDPGCEHKIAKRSMTGEILEPGCIAYELSSKTVMIWDDKLYFVADKEVRVSDRQGLNQRVIGKIPGYVTGYDIFFMKDKLFLIWGTQNELIEVKDDNGESRWIMGEQKEKETTGILCFDLNEKTWTKIFEAEDFQSYLSQYDIRGDHMRFAYWYWGLPYMDMNGETYGRKIPEEYTNLTPDEYRAEMDRQCWVDIYDYNSVTGELKAALKQKHLPAGRIAMCKDFFALPEDGETVFYRYDGEVFNRIEGAFVLNAWSDSHLVCSMENDPTNYVLIDETTGEILKKTAKPITPGTLYPAAIIGNSCYGSLTVDGLWSIGYISTADFWNGDLTNAVQMHYYSDTSMQSGAIWSTIPPTQEETTETTETTGTETMAETTEVQTEPTETTEPTTLSPEEEAYEASLPRVTWKLHYSSMIDQQNRDAINRLLKEKGMDFRIDFSTAMVDFDDYPKWLQTQIDNNNMPDIVTTPALAHGIFDQVAFAEKALLSLNDYLESEDGKALWETFSDLQWNLVKVNGNIYSIPDKKGGDNGAVLYV